jgi:hypothetical protein
MHNNYLNLDILADHVFSSEQTSFPITNIYNTQRRSKVWRSSNGYFPVASGRNKIIFREEVGIDLEATVAPANYLTAATFSNAVKNALDNAGASTYTIVQNSNLKFVITSNGVGGDGIFEIDWTHADSEDMASYLGFSDLLEDVGFLSYTADFLRIHAGGDDSEYILWDMGISTNPTAFILFGDRNKPIKISTDATIRLQGNPTNI